MRCAESKQSMACGLGWARSTQPLLVKLLADLTTS